MQPSSRRALQLVSRAIRRRCPSCGQTRIFTGWFRTLPSCPACGLQIERHEEGYRVGAMIFNIGFAEFVFVLALAGVIWRTWPNPPWEWLTWLGAGLMAALPVIFYPYSQTLFLGLDLLFHPPEQGDFDDGQER